MYEAQTETTILQRMLGQIKGAVDKLEGSLTYDAVAPVALELTNLYAELDRVLTLAFAQTTYGSYLDKRAGEFGVLRKDGNKATGSVTFTGSDGTAIPVGTHVQTNGALIFITLENATISSGTAMVNVEASNIGTSYNVPAGTVIQMPVQITGVTSVTNQATITGGSEIETDTALLERLLLKVQSPATSGNASHYKQWALAISGIGAAKVFPEALGAGTVKIVLLDTDMQPANSTLVSKVESYINENRPIGATPTVIAATALTINISADITIATGYVLANITPVIQDKIRAYLSSIAFKSSFVSIALIGNAILDCEGILDYTNLTVNEGTANIAVGSEQVAVLGMVTIT